MSKCSGLRLAGRDGGFGCGYRLRVWVRVAGKHKSPNLTLNYQQNKGKFDYVSKTICDTFFGPQVITRKSSYLKLTKGDTKEKVTEEKSTKLQPLVKLALSNRVTCVWDL